MAVVNGPQLPNIPAGKAVLIGTWTATGQQLQFSTSTMSWLRQSVVILQFDYNNPATVAGAFNILASVDKGVNFPVLASAVALPTGVSNAIISQTLVGSGEILWQLSLTTFPTGVTSIAVWGLVG